MSALLAPWVGADMQIDPGAVERLLNLGRALKAEVPMGVMWREGPGSREG